MKKKRKKYVGFQVGLGFVVKKKNQQKKRNGT